LVILSWIPLALAQHLGKLIGRANWLLNSRSARVTQANLELCFPDMEARQRQALALSSLMHTGQMVLETPIVWLRDIQKTSRHIVSCKGEELLLAAMAEGRGVVIILPHLGNWEMFNLVYQYPLPMVGLYNPPGDETLDRFLDKVRNRFGNRVVPTSKAGLATLYRSLKKGWAVTILPDQIPATGEFAPFFGISALTDPLIPRLIRKSGAKAVCVSILRMSRPARFEVEFTEPDSRIYNSDLRVSLCGLNQTIEKSVLRAPQQYQWEYKRFKAQPPGQKNPYKP